MTSNKLPLCRNRCCHTQTSSAAPEDASAPKTWGGQKLTMLKEAKNEIQNEKKSQQNRQGIKIQHKLSNYDYENNATFSAMATLFQILLLPNLKNNLKKVCDISEPSTD